MYPLHICANLTIWPNTIRRINARMMKNVNPGPNFTKDTKDFTLLSFADELNTVIFGPEVLITQIWAHSIVCILRKKRRRSTNVKTSIQPSLIPNWRKCITVTQNTMARPRSAQAHMNTWRYMWGIASYPVKMVLKSTRVRLTTWMRTSPTFMLRDVWVQESRAGLIVVRIRSWSPICLPLSNLRNQFERPSYMNLQTSTKSGLRWECSINFAIYFFAMAISNL